MAAVKFIAETLFQNIREAQGKNMSGSGPEATIPNQSAIGPRDFLCTHLGNLVKLVGSNSIFTDGELDG